MALRIHTKGNALVLKKTVDSIGVTAGTGKESKR